MYTSVDDQGYDHKQTDLGCEHSLTMALLHLNLQSLMLNLCFKTSRLIVSRRQSYWLTSNEFYLVHLDVDLITVQALQGFGGDELVVRLVFLQSDPVFQSTATLQQEQLNQISIRTWKELFEGRKDIVFEFSQGVPHKVSS